MDGQTVPPSAFRQPPPPTRCKTPMLSGGRCGRSYLNSTPRFLMRKARKATIDSLSDDLLIDILARFAADFLHDRAMLVCRRWCRIIQSRTFIDTQFPHSTYGLVLSSTSLSRCYPYSLYVTATQEGRIRISELSSIRDNKILASGDGLAVELRHVDVNDEYLSLHVINPTTRHSLILPSVSVGNREVYHEKCGIAYSAASMEYKVTLPYYDDRLKSTCLDIVTVGVDKSWRHVEIPSLLEGVGSLFYSLPLSSEGGFLHWVSKIYCLTLNVETEIFTMSEAPIPLDQRYDHYSYYYLSTGRYLSLLVGRRRKLLWEVWEMRPAESRDHQWRKVVLPNIDLEDKKCSLQQFSDKAELFPFGWVKYPELLAFRFSGSAKTCIFYNLKTHEIETIELPHHACRDYRAIVHRNSLVRLSQDLRVKTKE